MTDRLTVLMVDDEERLRSTTSKLLNRRGYQTLIAANGEEALAIIRTQRPDVVILDYASIMRSNRKYDALRHEIASIFRELHALSHEKRVPLWTAHQTNRGGMQSKVIGMEDLGECFEVGAIADVIISLNQTLDERRRGIMRMHFAKNRENEAGATEAVAVDFTLSRIRDYDD